MRMINEIAQTAEPSEEVVEPLRGPGPEPSFRQNVGQQSSNPQSENPQGDGSATSFAQDALHRRMNCNKACERNQRVRAEEEKQYGER